MALKITQRTLSRQATQDPKQTARSKAISAPTRGLERRQTTYIPEPVDYRSKTAPEQLKGTSIAPLVTRIAPFEVNGFRLSETVHGWGGYSIAFLDTHPELQALFAGLNKWLFGSGEKWRVSTSSRYILSIEGVIQ